MEKGGLPKCEEAGNVVLGPIEESGPVGHVGEEFDSA